MQLSDRFSAALKLYQNGSTLESIDICREIIRSHPDNIDALILLGLLHHQCNKTDMAENYFEQALRSDPANSYALFYLGNLLQEKGELEEAAVCFQKAVEKDPSFGDAHYDLAIVLERMGELEKALVSYKKALALSPDLPDAYNNAGNILIKMRRFEDAVPYLRNALKIDPAYVLALNNLAMALKGQGDLDKAEACLRKALETVPSFADAYFNLAIVLKEKNDTDSAVINLKKALELNPSFADAYYNLAVIQKEKNDMDNAVTNLRKVLELNPSFADAYSNLAAISEEAGMLEEAISYYRDALSINPEDAEVHWNLSLVLLSAGYLKQGWREYEWRFQVKDFRRDSHPLPGWDGSSPEGRGLFIYAEQGVGEEIMFASCLPELTSRAGHCVIECDRRLVPVFARSFPRAEVISREQYLMNSRQYTSSSDMKVSIGSLPLFLRPDLSSFPELKSYLLPDIQKVGLWRSRFEALGKGLKIGISWRGGGKASDRILRSTILDQWTDLLTMPGAHFINLQYGDCSVELKEAERRCGVIIHHWDDSDPLKDLDGFAAQIAALDLVISVDNATVHMAGALGATVWTLLPFCCDWRWMRDFEDTPWYRSMRLFRQRSQGNWNEVFERLCSALKSYAETGAVPEIAHSYKSPTGEIGIITPGH